MLRPNTGERLKRLFHSVQSILVRGFICLMWACWTARYNVLVTQQRIPSGFQGGVGSERAVRVRSVRRNEGQCP